MERSPRPVGQRSHMLFELDTERFRQTGALDSASGQLPDVARAFVGVGADCSPRNASRKGEKQTQGKNQPRLHAAGGGDFADSPSETSQPRVAD